MTQAIFFLFFFSALFADVTLGVDVFFDEGYYKSIKNKRIALLTNHTGVDSQMRSTIERLQEHFTLEALFSPEHGIDGSHYAAAKVSHDKKGQTPLYSLHGSTRRPTQEMLEKLDVVIYDIQCTGVRGYTYPTTLFYMMEEAAKRDIEVIVLDRPNPINGLTVDGTMLEDKWRSFIGYINVPYCHGMTIGELACFFNSEYQIGCKLTVIPMKGWKRSMSYRDTGLNWIPPSPNIPEPDTPLFSCTTGLLGELSVLNIGIGYTMPFKIVGAPWIDAKQLANKLNEQKLPGVHFQPFHFKPFWGAYKGESCKGVMIQITNPSIYKPLTVQYFLLGLLKSLYPAQFVKRLTDSPSKKDLFCKANGTAEVYNLLQSEKYPAWKLTQLHKTERTAFLEVRKKYLLYKE